MTIDCRLLALQFKQVTMTIAKLRAVATVFYLMLITGLDMVEQKHNDTDSCMLRIKENESRVRVEVAREMREEMKNEVKSQFKRFQLSRNKRAQRQGEVDLSNEVRVLEAALLECTVLVVATSTTCRIGKSTMTNTSVKPVSCPGGFVRFEDHCYLLSLEENNWTTARTTCRIMGADLVSINTQAENDFLVSAIKKYFPPGTGGYIFWLGMIYVGGKNMWADGTEVGFTDWIPSPLPSCKGEPCKAYITTYRSTYKWSGGQKKYVHFSICEKDAA
ncbi:low affinity immunoglobulin epsilon Fc receptor-like [Haliotis rufescens]|uniref:low affinity immunoglobulin epsilon Fc receptor-like n=1 Tax=Haliotis rufescens TaxID=6454 RepID=UPI001EAFB194|nr:low affinity immunoglobulin epsilon Fc receptor-like [Haliotis rufescens]